MESLRTPLLQDDLAINYSGEDGSLSNNGVHSFAVYKRRWWIAIVFTICSAAQSAQWAAFGPITNGIQIAYKWDDSYVAMIPAISNAACVLTVFPLMALVEARGLRAGMVLCVIFLLLTMAFWNFGFAFQQYWLIIIGAVCNGIAAPLTTSAAPLVSALWFPVNERTTCTAMTAGSSYLGNSLAFISGPYISTANLDWDKAISSKNYSAEFIHKLENGIQNVIYFHSGLTVFVFACIMIYFPSKPKLPPTRSASKERKDFRSGFQSMIRNFQFMLLNLAFNIPNGAYSSWMPFTSILFKPLGVSETSAGWIGFTGTMAGLLSSLVISWLSDHFKRKMKQTLIMATFIIILIFSLLLCVQEQYIKVSPSYMEAVLYVLVIALGCGMNGILPLFYELGCEMAFPVHEGLACSFITFLNNGIGMIYFLIFLIPSLSTDTRWMTWTCLASCIFSLPCLFLLKETYHRLNIEKGESSANLLT